jgi:hypothetical protein
MTKKNFTAIARAFAQERVFWERSGMPFHGALEAIDRLEVKLMAEFATANNMFSFEKFLEASHDNN